MADYIRISRLVNFQSAATHIDTAPRFIALDLARQLIPSTFEPALNHLLDYEVDLSPFDVRFHTHDTGASAYPPAMLLKVVLFAYSRGLVSSRSIAQACVEHVTFIALSDDSQPHFTTLAHFISTLGEVIASSIAFSLQRGAGRTVPLCNT